MLADQALSLEQVAGRLGFSNTSSLVRAFRRWHNSTPMSYRRQVLG
ncbi:MAG: helix-turn-helix domain-containing protein [Pseudomonas sp.]